MAKKIYTIANYLYIDDTITGKRISGSKSLFEFVSGSVNASSFTVLKNKQAVLTISIQESVNLNGIPYTLQSFQDFKEQNTGFKTASGGSEVLPKTITEYINEFKARVQKENGTFESESSLVSILNKINNAGLLDSTTYLLTANAVKKDKTFAIFPEIGAGDMVTTRNSLATRTNSSGNRVSMPANIQRLDYELGTKPAGLFEGQSTNLILNSAVVQTQAINITNVQHTISFYGTGTLTLTGVANITLVGTGENDLVSLTFSPTIGGVVTIGGSGSRTEGQLEIGIEATSRIKTLGVPVTRIADVGNKSDLAYLLGQQEGTLFARLARNTGVNSPRVVSISDGTANNYITLGFTDSGNLVFEVKIDSEIVLSGSSIVSNKNQFYDILVVYKSGEFAAWIDGVEVASSNLIKSFNATLKELTFSLNNSNSYRGRYEYVAHWDKRITNSQINILMS